MLTLFNCRSNIIQIMVADTTNKFLPGQSGMMRLYEKYGDRKMKTGSGSQNMAKGYWDLPYREVLSSEHGNWIIKD